MVRARVPEIEGVLGELNVRIYDRMQRRLRDKGWLETKAIIAAGIDHGLALEIGPGPGYLGLEWLKRTRDTQLRAAELSADMIPIAEANAREYGLAERVRYVQANAQQLPFDDGAFDAVFTNGSLHEWSAPGQIFGEIRRALKPGGRFFVSDLRRDMRLPVRWFLYSLAKPKEIRPGLIASLNAAYTAAEAETLVTRSGLRVTRATSNPMGFEIVGEKAIE
jgi:ubiquinone/menaquinone biosynthesis C-methylase UbiE